MLRPRRSSIGRLLAIAFVTCLCFGRVASAGNEEAVAAEFAAATPASRPAVYGRAVREFDPDPWLVAWWIAAHAPTEAVTAWADVARGAPSLRAHFASRDTRPDPATIEAVRAAESAIGSEDFSALIAVAERLDPKSDAFLRAWRLLRRGIARLQQGDASAVSEIEAAERAARALGWTAGVADACFHLGQHRFANDHDYAAGLVQFRRAQAASAEAGDVILAAIQEGNVAAALGFLGDNGAALASFDHALVALRSVDHWSVGSNSNNASVIAARHGAYALSIRYAEEALDVSRRTGREVDGGLARAHRASARWRSGDLDGAESDGAAALEILRRIGSPGDVADATANLGGIAWAKQDAVRALASYEAARRLARAQDNLEADAAIAENLGEILHATGKLDDALAELRHAETTGEKVKRLDVVADALRERAAVLITQGHPADAPALLDRALAKAEEGDALDQQVRILGERARVRLASGNEAGALVDARTACERARTLSRGLADVDASAERSLHSSVQEVGASIAVRRKDAESLLFFLEAGRGGALLETIESRDAFRRARVPEALRKAEDDAVTTAAIASHAYQDALGTGVLATIRAAREALDGARAQARAVAGRRDREAKAIAGALAPPPAAVASIKKRLAAQDAFVVFGEADGRVVSLVIRPEGSRLIDLGPSEALAQDIESFRDSIKDRADPREAVARLRARLVAPVALAPGVTRVVISPDANLSLVPWSLLWLDKETACVPSAAVWGVLASRGGAAGRGVLALGAPDYAKERGLAPLPATKDEVNAVGDLILIGADSTEAKLLESLRSRPRWSALHLACHGIPDARFPEECALALTATDKDDGRFTSLEVLATDVVADLVVLSACESGVGAAQRGEGAMSLARAFLAAGAPRVICSLWKVDDDATRALMTKFHQLRSPKGGGPGLAVSTALREAQKFVAGQDKWENPRYWAPWQLWGLPD